MCPIHRIRGFQQLPGPRQIRHWSGRSSPPLCRAPAQSVPLVTKQGRRVVSVRVEAWQEDPRPARRDGAGAVPGAFRV